MSDRKRKLDVFTGDASATQNGSALVSPLTGRPYSQRYHDILAKRKGAQRPGVRCELYLTATIFAMCCHFVNAEGHCATSLVKN